MLKKTEEKRRSGWQRMRWLDSITDLMDIKLSKLYEIVEKGEPGVLQSMGSQRVGHDLVTEQRQRPHQGPICGVCYGINASCIK